MKKLTLQDFDWLEPKSNYISSYSIPKAFIKFDINKKSVLKFPENIKAAQFYVNGRFVDHYLFDYLDKEKLTCSVALKNDAIIVFIDPPEGFPLQPIHYQNKAAGTNAISIGNKGLIIDILKKLKIEEKGEKKRITLSFQKLEDYKETVFQFEIESYEER